MTTTVGEADRLVNERLARLPSVAHLRAHYANGVVVDGSRYRLTDLTEAQRKAVSNLRSPGADARQSAPTAAQRAIAAELVDDVRRSASEVAHRTGMSITYVQRQITRLNTSPWFVPRADFSLVDFGLYAVYLWVQCPAGRLEELIALSRRIQGLRFLVPLIAAANVLLMLWVPSLDQIFEFERRLVKSLPGVEIIDRSVETSTRKRLGVTLDRSGRRTV